MINYSMTSAHAAMERLGIVERESLRLHLKSLKERPGQAHFADDEVKAGARVALDRCHDAFDDIGSDAIQDRMGRFERALTGPMLWVDLEKQATTLREVIEDELKRHYFNHYPPAMGALLVGFEDTWEPVIAAFPSTADEASAAVDCIALGHGTAGIFHLMRVLEYGIGALAGEVGKTFDKQMWHGIIDEIESAIRQFQRTASKEEREKKLAFLSAAAIELRYFKDAWRNHVSHNKSSYDEDQAISVMNHVLSFMKILSKNDLAERMA